MNKIFGLDSPLIQFLNKVADLMWLNILTMLCCIPVVTIGVSLTSAHYVALKMKRNEEGYISKEFFKAFKMNFKQSTLIWLIIMVIAAVIGADLYIIKEMDLGIPEFLQVAIMAIGILVLFMTVWVFPMQAKFINTLSKTMKNAFALSVIQIPKTILMIILYVAPPFLCIWFMQIFPIYFVLGISLPVYVSAILYNKVFQKLEDRIQERIAEENGENGEEESEDAEDDVTGEDAEETEAIFSDKPIFNEEEKQQ